MQRFDLSPLDWTLKGWLPQAWRLSQSMEIDHASRPQFEAIQAAVPGSVQQALLEAGMVEDWNQGLNSLKVEWVEHRHWEFSAWLPEEWSFKGRPVCLNAQGLDHQGVILINQTQVAEFEGCLRPHRFDLTPFLEEGRPNCLRIILTGAPDEQGQVGFTSRSRHFKPRFTYQWDWCPRLVTLGVWDRLELEVGGPNLRNVQPCARLLEDNRTGSLSLRAKLWSGTAIKVRLEATLKRGAQTLACAHIDCSLGEGERTCELEFGSLPAVEPWQPNGQGDPVLYDLEVRLLCGDQAVDLWQGRVGFKRVDWLPCQDAPQGALPWICEVNGQPVFLQGINWTPIRPNYHDLNDQDYVSRLQTYAQAGFNMVRVWGGGLIEKEIFYDLCDELGLLVWQEFPLSSSALDNTPPSDPQVIATLVEIASSAIERRGGHVSLLLWCGGNELQTSSSRQTAGCGWPWDLSHPCLAALALVTDQLAPGVRFLPTSAYGPTFLAFESEFGKGRHHNVHGPWIMPGSLEEWQSYWDGDDSLFRAELGLPSASPLDLLLNYKGECELWPPSPDNPYWAHPGLWWVQWEKYKDQLPEQGGLEGIERYIELTQTSQAQGLVCAASACKARFPRCGGFVLWMGHDCFPCAANTSLLDYWGRPKPALHALEAVLKSAPVELEAGQQNPLAVQVSG